MKRVWSGKIALNDQGDFLHDMHFSTSKALTETIMHAEAKLSFLSIVVLAQVPLYLALGPSLEVFTDYQASINWLSELLLSSKTIIDSDGEHEDPWWSQPVGQSEHGILLSVKDGKKTGTKGPCPTEVLLYAAVDMQEPKSSTTSALSSAIIRDNGSPPLFRATTPTLRVYALPLSSNILERVHHFTGLASPPWEEDCQAYFLPDYTFDQLANSKRRNISTLFDDATNQRRKLKGRGGESVAHTMAKFDRVFPQQSAAQPQNVEDDQTHKAFEDGERRRKLVRSASTETFYIPDASRPVFRTTSLTGPKRSSLRRVESAYSVPEGSVISHVGNSISEQNRTALSKIVMAGMRLHGLQQRKKPGDEVSYGGLSRRSSMLTGIRTDQDKEDEYKVIYHQTLKAAMFAFRNHVNSKLINQEAIRDMVDRLLDMFCSDPLSSTGGIVLTPNGLQVDAANPFDLPSLSQQATTNHPGWGTPPTRKRKTSDLTNADAG